jgi:hypothetical protein
MRTTLFTFAFIATATIPVVAQSTVARHGKAFTKELKGSTGDLFTVVDGIFAADGRHVLYVEEGLTPKVVRLDAQLVPSEELVLKEVLIDGLKWTGVRPIVQEGGLQVLLVSSTKKGSAFALCPVNTSGALGLGSLKQLASFDIPYVNDPAFTMVERPLPDPILFTRGLAYAQQERLVSSADGTTWLLNHFTHKGKGNKRFGMALVNPDGTVRSTTTVELPYEDATSTIHQISVANDGTVRLLTYVYSCKSDEQLGDKACHELHLTTVSEGGKTVQDLLLDKQFISSARLVDRQDGRVSIAVRYGALTGLPGQVITFSPKDPKLKPTPVLAQRLPSIRRAKLMPYGDPAADPRKPVARTAKLPIDVVDLIAAPNNELVVIETFLETNFQLPMGEAIAMRRLSGGVRVSQVLTNDSIGWQRVLDRAAMTTAGQPYDGVSRLAYKEGHLLLYAHTPRGLEAILRSGVEAAGTKEMKPAEPLVLKAALISEGGEVRQEGTLLLFEDDFIPCISGVLLEPGGTHALVKSYDRGTQYRFSMLDLQALGQ